MWIELCLTLLLFNWAGDGSKGCAELAIFIYDTQINSAFYFPI